jgi:hypothetical protein
MLVALKDTNSAHINIKNNLIKLWSKNLNNPQNDVENLTVTAPFSRIFTVFTD